MTRRLLALAIATAMGAVSLWVPSGPADAKTTGGKPKEGKIPIIVPVDVLAPEGATVPDGEGNQVHPADFWKASAEKIWNEAFKHLPYKNCYKFELEVDVEKRPFTAEARDGRHLFFFTGGRGGSVLNEFGTATPPAFDHSLDGHMGTDTDRVAAHEFGHLLGLDDDYTVVSKNPRETKPKDGRGNTLMADQGPIDQNLVDRIGDILDSKGLLPECETWTGSLSMSLQLAELCEGSADGEVRLSVIDDAVTATITESGSFTCPFLPGLDLPQSSSFDLAGTFEDDEFVFTGITALAAEGVHSGDICFPPFLGQPSLVVGVDPPGSASADWTTEWTTESGTGTVSCQMSLERVEEEPAVG